VERQEGKRDAGAGHVGCPLKGNSCDVVHALVAIIDTKAHQAHECEATYGESYDGDYDASFENELSHDDYSFWICFAVGSALTNEGGDQREVSDLSF
jgi:hypothetical protein